MVRCKFYALGKCKYGDRCRFSKLAKKSNFRKRKSDSDSDKEVVIKKIKITKNFSYTCQFC